MISPEEGVKTERPVITESRPIPYGGVTVEILDRAWRIRNREGLLRDGRPAATGKIDLDGVGLTGK